MKTTILSGATGGIGTAVARRLVTAGHQVCLLGRDRQSGTTLAGELQAAGANCQFYGCDVRDSEQIDSCIKRAHAEVGLLHSLVTAHGVLPTPTNFASTKLAAFDEAYTINFRSTVTLMQAFMRALGEDKGVIVNIASIAGTRAFPLSAAYAASKAALIQASKVLAQEAGERIRVNVINPGWIRTPMTARVQQIFSIAERDAVKPYPFRRAGLPEEVAETVHWLVSDSSSFVSGAVINIDGGGLP